MVVQLLYMISLQERYCTKCQLQMSSLFTGTLIPHTLLSLLRLVSAVIKIYGVELVIVNKNLEIASQ